MARNDHTRAALSAVEIYRGLQQAMDPQARAAPLELALLDYSGFKLEALSRSPQADCKAIAAANSEAASFWKTLEPRVKDKALKKTMATIRGGFSEAVPRRDPHQAAFASRVLLDFVDLLEGQFR